MGGTVATISPAEEAGQLARGSDRAGARLAHAAQEGASTTREGRRPAVDLHGRPCCGYRLATVACRVGRGRALSRATQDRAFLRVPSLRPGCESNQGRHSTRWRPRNRRVWLRPKRPGVDLEYGFATIRRQMAFGPALLGVRRSPGNRPARSAYPVVDRELCGSSRGCHLSGTRIREAHRRRREYVEGGLIREMAERSSNRARLTGVGGRNRSSTNALFGARCHPERGRPARSVRM